MNLDIKHKSEEQQFYAYLNHDKMILCYQRVSPKAIDFKSTFVPVPYRKKGLGSLLVARGLQFAREHGFQVKTSCPFVARFMDAHPEYQGLMLYSFF